LANDEGNHVIIDTPHLHKKKVPQLQDHFPSGEYYQRREIEEKITPDAAYS
jgi:hypothetical protein